MLYIVSIRKYCSTELRILYYRMFDTYSHSLMLIHPDMLKHIILHTEMQVANATVQNGHIVTPDWVNKLTKFTGVGNGSRQSECKYVLTAIEEDNRYKIVDEEGNLSTLREEDLVAIVRSGEVANCTITDNGGIHATETYTIHKDRAFEELILKKYNNFVAKTTILGYTGISFEYEIENAEVRLKKYTGSNRHVILPSFITAIMGDAFTYPNILTINMNEGLKVIGVRAFSTTKLFGELRYVEIPSTVELVGNKAFIDNPRLVDTNGKIKTDHFKLRNAETLVLEQA